MKPFILALTGPTGSGKSTVASRLANDIPQSVNIEVDQVKHFIVNGFMYESPEGSAQWELLGVNIGQLAKNFHEAGYNVIINGYLRGVSWGKIEQYVEIDQKILLMPHVDTVAERDQGRQYNDQMGIEAVKEHYDYFSSIKFYDTFERIDSTKQSIEETTASIKNKLQMGNITPTVAL